jgi:hypothetical protein
VLAAHSYRELTARLREPIQRGEVAAQLPSITTLTGQTDLAVGTAPGRSVRR